MNSAYKKECYVALIAFGLVTIMTHIFPMYFLFPSLTESTIFGFPTHYFLTIIIGWLFLIPLYWIYINLSDKIDEEIAESAEESSPSKEDAPWRKTAADARQGGE